MLENTWLYPTTWCVLGEQCFSSWLHCLCMHLMIFTRIKKFNIRHIFSANSGLKIGQRYHKLLNGTHHFPFDVATVKVKAFAK